MFGLNCFNITYCLLVVTLWIEVPKMRLCVQPRNNPETFLVTILY